MGDPTTFTSADNSACIASSKGRVSFSQPLRGCACGQDAWKFITKQEAASLNHFWGWVVSKLIRVLILLPLVLGLLGGKLAFGQGGATGAISGSGVDGSGAWRG